MKNCPACNGTGSARSGRPCPACEGEGKVTPERYKKITEIRREIKTPKKTSNWTLC